jgi:hypothetical protein
LSGATPLQENGIGHPFLEEVGGIPAVGICPIHDRKPMPFEESKALTSKWDTCGLAITVGESGTDGHIRLVTDRHVARPQLGLELCKRRLRDVSRALDGDPHVRQDVLYLWVHLGLPRTPSIVPVQEIEPPSSGTFVAAIGRVHHHSAGTLAQ